MSVEAVVRAFKRIGATCRLVKRKRGYRVYECVKGHTRALIDESWRTITVFPLTDFRVEFFNFGETKYTVSESALTGEEFLDELRRINGRPELKFEGAVAQLGLEYKFEDLDKAVKIFDKLAKEDMWIALTNIDAELRCYIGDKRIPCSEWLEKLEN